jgi:hypothetical protein
MLSLADPVCSTAHGGVKARCTYGKIDPLEENMTLPARLKCIGRLAIAPIKGFFA